MEEVILVPLEESDRDQFILDNQEAFRFGAMEEFGPVDKHMEDDGEIISREVIEHSIDTGKAYRIMAGGEKAGGAVISINGKRGELELLFIRPDAHSRGIGYSAWCIIESMFPEVEIWETSTPYFEKRNIHFYVNRCGFHIVEFFNAKHPDPNDPDTAGEEAFNGMFRFEKKMR